MLGFDIRWSEVPMIIKIGLFLWLIAILCFVFMIASAIFPFMHTPTQSLLNIAYFGAVTFIIGVLMVAFGLPKTTNHHPGAQDDPEKSK